MYPIISQGFGIFNIFIDFKLHFLQEDFSFINLILGFNRFVT